MTTNIARLGGSCRWVSVALGLILLHAGAAMMYRGVLLITLDGAWYYAIAGAVLLIAAVQLLRARRSGFLIYAGFCVATLAWALYECGWNPITLLPRVLFFLVLLNVMLLGWRWFARPFARDHEQVRGTALALLVGSALTWFLFGLFGVDGLRESGRMWAKSTPRSSPHMSPLYADLHGMLPLRTFHGNRDHLLLTERGLH